MIRTIQTAFGEAALPFWKAVTILGDGFFVFLAFAVIAWTWSTTRAVQVGLVGVVVGVLVGLLKVAVREPRPYLIDPTIVPWQASVGFGMPSGHAASVVGLAAPLWLHRRDGRVLVLALAAILLVGFSRLYLGVHTAGQVVAGWGLGLGVVVVAHRFGGAIGDVLSRPGPRVHVVFATLCCVALALVQHVLSVRLSEGFVVPSAWLERVDVARALAGGPADAGSDRLTTADLFEPHRVHLPALLLGMWLSGMAVAAGRTVKRFDHVDRALNLLIGSLVLPASIVSILLAREVPVLPSLLICATPPVVAIGVPWLTAKLRGIGSR